METNISKEDLYLFQTGKAQKAYLMFGCHYLKEADAHEFVDGHQMPSLSVWSETLISGIRFHIR